MEPNNNLVARESTEVIPCMLTTSTRSRFQVLLEVRMTDWGKKKKGRMAEYLFKKQIPRSIPPQQTG